MHAQRVLVDAQTGIPAFGRRRMDDDAFNQGPAVAALCDWENGPQSLHGPHMPMWKPIEG